MVILLHHFDLIYNFLVFSFNIFLRIYWKFSIKLSTIKLIVLFFFSKEKSRQHLDLDTTGSNFANIFSKLCSKCSQSIIIEIFQMSNFTINSLEMLLKSVQTLRSLQYFTLYTLKVNDLSLYISSLIRTLANLLFDPNLTVLWTLMVFVKWAI